MRIRLIVAVCLLAALATTEAAVYVSRRSHAPTSVAAAVVYSKTHQWPVYATDATSAVDAVENDDMIYKLGAHVQTNGGSTFSVSFDGVDDYTQGTAVDCSTNDIVSVSAWVYPLTTNGVQAIVSQWDDPNPGQRQYFFALAYGKPYLQILEADGDSPYVWGDTIAITGTWTHVVGVANKTNLFCFINGTNDATPVSYDGTLNPSATPHLWGKLKDGFTTYIYFGLIDQATISKLAWSTNDAINIFGAGH